MRVEAIGEEGDTDLLLLLGWGNHVAHENVRWLVDLLADAGHRVHAVEIPTNVGDFREGYLAPVERYAADLDDYRIVGHSTGGLIAAHLETDRRRVYLSPWWGIYGADVRPLLFRFLRSLPVGRPVWPVPLDRDAVGGLATDGQFETTPRYVAPRFVREVHRAQESLPAFREGSVVFCTLRDRVVDPGAIGEHAPPENVVLYDGGHELFSSSCRAAHADRLVATVREGAAALPSRDA